MLQLSATLRIAESVVKVYMLAFEQRFEKRLDCGCFVSEVTRVIPYGTHPPGCKREVTHDLIEVRRYLLFLHPYLCNVLVRCYVPQLLDVVKHLQRGTFYYAYVEHVNVTVEQTAEHACLVVRPNAVVRTCKRGRVGVYAQPFPLFSTRQYFRPIYTLEYLSLLCVLELSQIETFTIRAGQLREVTYIILRKILRIVFGLHKKVRLSRTLFLGQLRSVLTLILQETFVREVIH